MKKTGQHEITGTIVNVSGLRVGGSDDLLQIGGTDLTVIKHPVTLRPYIPGSSLKGGLRSELEKRLGKFGRGGTEPCGCGQETCLVCRVFGPHKNTNYQYGPTRIIVRDCPVTGDFALEHKTENVINRKTGAAEHPRTLERVAAGAKWDMRISIQEWDLDAPCSHVPQGKTAAVKGGQALIEFVLDGLRAVVQTGIGSGISRGSGEIKIENLKVNGEPRTL